MDVQRAFLKSEPLGRDIYARPPLFTENGPSARCGLLKPLYGLEAEFREWYETLNYYPSEKLGGEATLLDKSVFF